MPTYDTMIGEKTPIIFDIGTAYIKCGFAGEASPRFILPSPFTHMNFKTTNLFEALKELFHRHLIVNPKERRLVIVESIMVPSSFKETLAAVFFMHFEVPSILFAPCHLVTLCTLGISTALVLDCGYSEAMVLPVYEGFTLLGAWQSSQLGSKHIHRELERQLREHSYFQPFGNEDKHEKIAESEKLSESLVEDIKVRACFVSPAERSALWQNWLSSSLWQGTNPNAAPMPHYAESTFICTFAGGRQIHVPSFLREIAVDGLFSGQENDGISIQKLILECLLACPIDCRKQLAENIVVIGGTSMLPGFNERLNEELKASLENESRFSPLAALKDSLKFHNPPAKANYTAWLGGSIFGALESLPGRSLQRSSYLEKRLLPDWDAILDDFVALGRDADVEAKNTR